MTALPITTPQLETFFWNGLDPMLVLDERLHVVRSNGSGERQLRCGRGEPVLEACAPADRERIAAALRQGASTFQAAIQSRDQGVRTYEWSVAEPAHGMLYVVLRDVTARGRPERELAQAQKLEAVGHLASGIAHEINSPVQYVGDSLTFITESLHDVFRLLAALEQHPPSRPLLAKYPAIDLAFLNAELPAAVEQACEGVQRVAELVQGLKEFAHSDGGQVTSTDLNRALERTIAIARSEWKYVAELETDFQPIPPVPCIAGALRQVFLNLICNAAYANREQNERTGRALGRIKVSTRCDDTAVTVSVSDTGTGMDESVRGRLFEPFFTTKPFGKGTGQGLAISRAIVCDKHGGKLEFETELGVGTTFHVRLPLRFYPGRSA